MLNEYKNPLTPDEQWKKKYPTVLAGIFSAIQILMTIAIIGLEIGSILIDAIVGTVYVGIWAGVFFLFASISQAITGCCRNRLCAMYTFIMQFIALFFAACVIAFDVFYILNPTLCFFSSSICGMSGSYRGLFYSDSNFSNIKMSLIKAQLAAGCLMFLLCLVYVILFIVTVVRVFRVRRRAVVYPQGEKQPYPAAPAGSCGHAPGGILPNVITPGDNRNALLVCPSCSTAMNMTVNKRL